MCGIAGEISFDGEGIGDRWVREAASLMLHRGPDGEGFFTDTGVAFGHRRLSIIDLAGGRQPMPYQDGEYWITYNGEIYNYRALRIQLEAKGRTFETESDTEVVLAAYAVWGVDCLPRLDGIFAFGLWTRSTRSLLLARDQLGVKPLLYHCDSRGLRFASELKALLAHPHVERAVDPEGLQHYLALGYVLAPHSILRNVRKLEPGQYLIARDGQTRVSTYWDLAAAASASGRDSKQGENEQVAAFDALLGRTVSDQMVSDVPLGAFLSGGIDSSTIAYHACQRSLHPLESFSIGFREKSFNELGYARRTAAHLETRHHDRLVEAATLEELEQIAWYFDEPLGDTSVVPTYHLARLARERVSVALSGDGCDELLAGYDTYLADRLGGVYARLPGWLHRGVFEPAARRIPSSFRKVSLDFKAKQFISVAHANPSRAHYGWRSMFSPEQCRALTGATPIEIDAPFARYARHYAPVAEAAPLDRALYVDLKTWLVDDILVKLDRASMACGLEARVPFLAPGLVEFAMALPTRLKMRGLQRKVILRKAMRSRLPREVLRRRKRGFNAPVSHWLREGLRADVDALLASGSSQLVDSRDPLVTRLWREHTAGAVDHGFRLWTLLSLLLWERRVLA